MSSPRHRLLIVLLLLSVFVSCLHPQVGECRRHHPIERSLEHGTNDHRTSNDVDLRSNYTSNGGDYGGHVAVSEREIPTGPDPLHNREDQT
ncbi:hypothetical protein vseg_021456 [Gypsophila vaccaria]